MVGMGWQGPGAWGWGVGGEEGEQVATRRGPAGRGSRGWGREGRVHGKGCFRASATVAEENPTPGRASLWVSAHPGVTGTRAPDSLSINPRRA